ncbi:hypothetical protein B566_EDAN014025 [Ephemera danica]|nr:hypothetical protein B566_EDAN014025 [Ephemera danica]
MLMPNTRTLTTKTLVSSNHGKSCGSDLQDFDRSGYCHRCTVCFGTFSGRSCRQSDRWCTYLKPSSSCFECWLSRLGLFRVFWKSSLHRLKW